MSSSIRQLIDNAIKTNKVIIFSKSYCPYCDRAKSAIAKLGVPFHAIELDVEAEGPQIQEELLRMTSQRTVPNIFVSGNHVGGCDNTLAAISSGQFQRLLNGA